jgi:hypothetical protein
MFDPEDDEDNIREPGCLAAAFLAVCSIGGMMWLIYTIARIVLDNR